MLFSIFIYTLWVVVWLIIYIWLNFRQVVLKSIFVIIFFSYSQECDYPEYIGDGKCDEQLLTGVCKHDGGDCDSTYTIPDIEYEDYDYHDYQDYQLDQNNKDSDYDKEYAEYIYKEQLDEYYENYE